MQVTKALLTRARDGVQKDSQAGLKRDCARLLGAIAKMRR